MKKKWIKFSLIFIRLIILFLYFVIRGVIKEKFSTKNFYLTSFYQLKNLSQSINNFKVSQFLLISLLFSLRLLSLLIQIDVIRRDCNAAKELYPHWFLLLHIDFIDFVYLYHKQFDYFILFFFPLKLTEFCYNKLNKSGI